MFLLGGLYSSLQTLRIQLRTLNVQERGQITDRFTKAIEQLGATQSSSSSKASGSATTDNSPRPDLEVRIGGVYALEQIALDAPAEYWSIIEVLAAYVRDNSAITTTNPVQPDVQAVLTVLGRRDLKFDPLDHRVDLSNANLSNADLADANLNGAILLKSRLDGADLSGAKLIDADLDGASLKDTDLSHSDLSSAFFRNAMIDADLTQADLTGATLASANLAGSDLSQTDLTGADLSGTDLSKVENLTEQQLIGTLGDSKTNLPPGLTPANSWHR